MIDWLKAQFYWLRNAFTPPIPIVDTVEEPCDECADLCPTCWANGNCDMQRAICAVSEEFELITLVTSCPDYEDREKLNEEYRRVFEKEEFKTLGEMAAENQVRGFYDCVDERIAWAERQAEADAEKMRQILKRDSNAH